jgi:type I site-specific restriction-modification system R (restriction) subunit
LVCFVNGLLLVVIELKKPGVPARAALPTNDLATEEIQIIHK